MLAGVKEYVFDKMCILPNYLCTEKRIVRLNHVNQSIQKGIDAIGLSGFVQVGEVWSLPTLQSNFFYNIYNRFLLISRSTIPAINIENEGLKLHVYCDRVEIDRGENLKYPSLSQKILLSRAIFPKLGDMQLYVEILPEQIVSDTEIRRSMIMTTEIDGVLLRISYIQIKNSNNGYWSQYHNFGQIEVVATSSDLIN